MDQINKEILLQLEAKGLKINEDIAIDARIIHSACHLLSNNETKKLEKRNPLH